MVIDRSGVEKKGSFTLFLIVVVFFFLCCRQVSFRHPYPAQCYGVTVYVFSIWEGYWYSFVMRVGRLSEREGSGSTIAPHCGVSFALSFHKFSGEVFFFHTCKTSDVCRSREIPQDLG